MEPELDIEEDKEYNVKVIKDIAVYINEVARSQLLGLYYFVS